MHRDSYKNDIAPIIVKGVLYPLQNRRTSKSATHGFASKLDTRHKTKGTHSGAFCLGWDSADATRLVQSTSAGSHSRRKPTGARSREARRGITERSGVTRRLENIISAFFDSEVFRNFVDAFLRRALLAHLFGSVDRFELTKCQSTNSCQSISTISLHFKEYVL